MIMSNKKLSYATLALHELEIIDDLITSLGNNNFSLPYLITDFISLSNTIFIQISFALYPFPSGYNIPASS